MVSIEEKTIRKILKEELNLDFKLVQYILDYMDDEIYLLTYLFDHLCDKSVETLYRSGKKSIRGCPLGAIHIN